MNADASSDPLASDLLHEERLFEPPEGFRAQANVRDLTPFQRANADRLRYWAELARELDWYEPFGEVLEWNPPDAKWFLGGKLNIAHNCLDRHLGDATRNKAAIIWEGEPGDTRTLTYLQLTREVCRCANALTGLGVGKGDRVAIYLPMIPEAAVAMLACARIGAVHSVVFGGFSPNSLAERINDSECKALITADAGWRRGKPLLLKQEADKALANCPSVKHVVVVRRDPHTEFDAPMQPGRDHWYHELLENASPEHEPERMDAEDNLYILYTSGTTGHPKGIVHTTGGYAVCAYATTKMVFDLKPEDIYWCSADVGWVTGHTYVVYGPLMNAATVVMYEGAPDWPGKDRFWQICAEHRVSVFYTAPTAIRAFMRWGDELPAKHDLSSLRLLGSVGEPINPEAWMWYREHIGKGRCPIVDTWWQTETGAIMIATLPGVAAQKPGYAGYPLPGISAELLDDEGNPASGETSLLAITEPWPSMLRTIWGDHDRYVQTYFSRWPSKPGVYFAGDGAKRDNDGRYLILGRVDDVLNVSGHRLGTMEVESALVHHKAVAEAAVIGKPHEIKGQVPVAFVSLAAGQEEHDGLRDELRQHVAEFIGALAKPEAILIAGDLPKTRSGKIMRRLLRNIVENQPLGDTTTLAEPSVVETLRDQWVNLYGGKAAD